MNPVPMTAARMSAIPLMGTPNGKATASGRQTAGGQPVTSSEAGLHTASYFDLSSAKVAR